MIERDDIVVAGLSHQGMVRKENQDSYGFIEPESEDLLEERGRLFIVADGLGGHRGGRVASKMAVDLIGKIYFSSEKKPIYPALLHAVEIANRSIYEASNKHEELRGMATTCTALVIRDQNIHMTHVGDSRAYLVRQGAIKQVSTDHTLVEEMVHSGIINEDEAKSHPDSHILTRSLGILQAVEMDVLDPPLQFQRGDSLLLCSDGLTVYLEDSEIFRIVSENSPDRACELLVETANERGGRDNITVEIIHFKTDVEQSQSFLEDTQPLEEKTDVDGAVTVPLEETVLYGQHQKYELGWTALFYLAYLAVMAGYFYFFFK
ncbi:MAG: Stp1/IreP family PP2C-type Ser/Thr phosphatase [Acidobacteria bacterium]|nr:Stp1/IreP family PP2C-type Ser/Thr phosphatase [Acidobacteriota bacterium]